MKKTKREFDTFRGSWYVYVKSGSYWKVMPRYFATEGAAIAYENEIQED